MSNNETPVILAPRFPSALTEIYEQRKRNAQLKALLSESLKYVYERSSKRGMHVPLLVSKQDADEFLDRIRAALAPEAAERGYTSTATTMPKQCTPADEGGSERRGEALVRTPKLTYPQLRRIDAWGKSRRISAAAMSRVLGISRNTLYDAWARRRAYRGCARG